MFDPIEFANEHQLSAEDMVDLLLDFVEEHDLADALEQFMADNADNYAGDWTEEDDDEPAGLEEEEDD